MGSQFNLWGCDVIQSCTVEMLLKHNMGRGGGGGPRGGGHKGGVDMGRKALAGLTLEGCLRSGVDGQIWNRIDSGDFWKGGEGAEM